MGRKNIFSSKPANFRQPYGGCLIWTGALVDGYGVAGRMGKVHRLVWESFNGPIPIGLCICHKCDNRACFLIDHLFLGTVADNNRDKKLKGRSGKGRPNLKNRGEKSFHAKLSQTDAEQIRLRYEAGELQWIIANEYKVHQSTISRIAGQKTFKTSTETI